MLQAMATPKLMGIEIVGDYLDLIKLYESIQAVIELKDEYGHLLLDKFSPDVSEQVRSFNYEIRHTYQCKYDSIELDIGLRNAHNEIQDDLKQGSENIETNYRNESGNLYYKVKIPYIEAIGCITILMEILQEIHSVEQVQKAELKSDAPFRLCIATVALLVAVLDDAIERSLGDYSLPEVRFFKNEFKKFDFRYIEFLNSFYLTKCAKMSIKDKKEMIYVLILLLLRIPKMDAVHNQYFSEMLLTIPDYMHFDEYMKIQSELSGDGEVYMDEIFGLVDWKGLDW